MCSFDASAGQINFRISSAHRTASAIELTVAYAPGPVILREFPGCKDGGGYQQNALAALIRPPRLLLLPCVRKRNNCGGEGGI
jgi:hypothetical protein